MSTRPRQPGRRSAAAPRGAVTPPRVVEALPKPLGSAEIGELQALLDVVPSPLDPLDVGMLDGFLCGVLLQPEKIPAARWLRHATDADGRPPPAGFAAARLHALVRRRYAELDHAIARRSWFDPWVFELSEVEDLAGAGDDDDVDPPPREIDAVYPWVAGFATALELFPALMHLPSDALSAPLALIYRHLAPDDLEDAADLLAEIETLEAPVDLAEAVEGLVRATLLLADVSRPLGTFK